MVRVRVRVRARARARARVRARARARARARIRARARADLWCGVHAQGFLELAQSDGHVQVPAGSLVHDLVP